MPNLLPASLGAGTLATHLNSDRQLAFGRSASTILALKKEETSGESGEDTKAAPEPKAGRTGASTPVENPSENLIDAELRGRTLRTYLFILKSSKAVGVRELQRALGLSSPSVAYHHLDKLMKIGLIEKDQYGEYTLVKNVNVNVLQAFTQVGKLLVPRFIFYAVFFTTLLLGYVLLFLGNLNPFAIAFGVFASIFAWYETYRTWKKRPF